MSQKRQIRSSRGMRGVNGIEPVVRSLSMRYDAGSLLPRHQHDWAQLVYASEGVMTVSTPQGAWVVPPQRAVWIPHDVEHSIVMSGTVFMQTLYLLPELADSLPSECRVVRVSPLLRELILYAIAQAPITRSNPEHNRLVDFLLDQLHALPIMPLELPMPQDPRALRVAERLKADLASSASLDDLARSAGVGKRTVERLFSTETGFTFGRWRTQARLLEALRMIAAGLPISSVALEVGYESPSAFIAMFRRVLGTTPSRYYPDQKHQHLRA